MNVKVRRGEEEEEEKRPGEDEMEEEGESLEEEKVKEEEHKKSVKATCVSRQVRAQMSNRESQDLGGRMD